MKTEITSTIPKILVISEATELTNNIIHCLKQSSVTVEIVSSGQEALIKLNNQEYALIFINRSIITSPGENLVKQLNPTKTTKFIPLFLFSSDLNTDESLTDLMAYGVVDFLFSSFNPIVLQGKVKNFLILYSQQKALESEIAEKAELERQHRESKEEAEKANSLKSKFLSTMSHEIRTPLNAILGVGEVLADTPLDLEQEKHVAMLQRAGDRLLMLINNILDFSKMEAGELLLEMIPFHVESLLNEIISLMTVQAHHKNSDIDLIYDIERDVPSALIGDSHRLTQILVNLIGNAIKFTQQGKISVHLKKVKSLPTATNDIVILQFSVKDTGIGIPKHAQKNIFDNFTQVDSSQTRKYGGTGLGLAICKKLVEMMGGQMQVMSEVHQGSTFYFTIPFQQQLSESESSFSFSTDLPQENISTVKSQKYFIDLKGVNILIIASNPEVRKQLKDILVDYQGNAREIDTIQKAQQIITHDHAVDLLIADCKMPGGNCFDLVHQLKETINLAEKCVFILPEQHRKSDIHDIRELQIASFFLQPINEEKLLGAIAKVSGMQERIQQVDDLFENLCPHEEEQAVTILIAEDSIDNQELLKAFLRKHPYILDFCDNGVIAYEKVKKSYKTYKLILMDMQMPDMDGYEATRRIREFEQHNDYGILPIIALSASTLKEEVEKAIACGCNAHISKPVKKRVLVDAIRKHTKSVR